MKLYLSNSLHVSAVVNLLITEFCVSCSYHLDITFHIGTQEVITLVKSRIPTKIINVRDIGCATLYWMNFFKNKDELTFS